jgi:hypothetical protein
MLVVVVVLVVSSASSSEEAQAPSGLYYLCSCVDLFVDEFNSDDLYIYTRGTHRSISTCRFRRGYAEASEPRRISATGTGVRHSGWQLHQMSTLPPPPAVAV